MWFTFSKSNVWNLHFVIALIGLLQRCGCELSGEAALYRMILDEYQMLERPVENHADAVKVHLTVELQQIIDIDEKNQIMEMNVWLHFKWYDKRLSWSPDDFDGVSDVRLPPSKVWKPDVLLFNSVDEHFDSTYASNVVVYSDGLIDWIPPAITRSSCSLNITWFPFDDQLCYLKFGSWSYAKDKLELINEGTDTSEYKLVLNGEWTLLDTPLQVEERNHSGAVHQYLYYKFRLRRRALYFGFNMITPSLLIASMSIWGFLLPVPSSEKITLEITVLLSICVFMGMVAQVTPITSESVPLLSVFCFCHMVAVTVSIIFSVLVLNMYYRTPRTHSMSKWTKIILLNWFPWLLMMKRPDYVLQPPPIFAKYSKSSDEPFGIKKRPSYRYIGALMKTAFVDRTRPALITVQKNKIGHTKAFLDNATPPKFEELQFNLDAELQMERSLISLLETDVPQSIPLLGPNGGRALQAMLVSLQQINNELSLITEHKKNEDEKEDSLNDWKFAAMVVDRICLLFFSTFMIVATFGVLFSAPNNQPGA